MIRIHDKTFTPWISAAALQQRVAELGAALSERFAGKEPLLLVLLNGAFVFAADLFRALSIPAEISFVRLASYSGMHSGGSVAVHWLPGTELAGRELIIVEDIIDTGNTLYTFLPLLQEKAPAGITIVSLLCKPGALRHPEVRADYTGFDIPDRFVVGYGLDYDGYGRNLPGLYRLADE